MSRNFREYTKPWIGRESPAKKEKRSWEIFARLKKAYPEARMALHYQTPIQLLVAVILSAQCTDKKVNEVTEPLFKKYKTALDFASIPQRTLENYIKPTGFYHTKARHIVAAAKKIEKEFGSRLPKTMEEITSLAGVARKTGNIVLGNAYGIVEGIAVDTHVSRLAQRFGLTNSDNPIKIEQDLMNMLPKKEWFHSTYLMIEHGRAICTAQRRKCKICPLRNICPSSLV